MSRKYIASLLGVVLILLGCGEGNESIFATDTLTKGRHLNTRSLDQLLTDPNPVDTKLSFAVISDSHQDYNDLDSVVGRLNARNDISFVIGGGDFTDLAHAFEYDLFIRSISALHVPFVTVIGNHDAIGRGPELFRKLFGPLNVSFQIQNLKLILWNNNALEFPGKIDFDWVESEIEFASTEDAVILVNHVDNFSSSTFNLSEIRRQESIISNPKLDLVINGHRHVFGKSQHGGTPIFQVARVRDQQYAIVTVDSDVLAIQSCVRSHCREELRVGN